MTLNLYDGAEVRTRNGARFIIRPTEGPIAGYNREFPWSSREGAIKHSWKSDGRYANFMSPHRYDIVEVIEPKAPVRTETKRRVFMTESGTTLNLYDGAHVVLRNGTKAVIHHQDRLSEYTHPWIDETGLITWDNNGFEVAPEQPTGLDITSIEMKPGDWVEIPFEFKISEPFDESKLAQLVPDYEKACTCPPDERPAECQHRYALRECWLESAKKDYSSLFDEIPYIDFIGTRKFPADAKFKARNGTIFTGLTFLQDEFFTSQRDYTWRVSSGFCLRAPHFDESLSSVRSNTMNYDIASVLIPKKPAELAMTKTAEDKGKPTNEVYENLVSWIAEVHQKTISQRALYEEFKPSKALQKLIVQMAKAVGGKLDKWRWVTSSEIEITVRFKSKLRNVFEPSEYTKTIMLTASGCDNNAVLPMRPRK